MVATELVVVGVPSAVLLKPTEVVLVFGGVLFVHDVLVEIVVLEAWPLAVVELETWIVVCCVE